MGKILPIVLALVGLGAGVGGGLLMRPAPAETVEIQPCGDTPADAGTSHEGASSAGDHAGDEGPSAKEYVKLNNQFIVPVVANGAVVAMVILSISLEVKPGGSEKVYALEPKLRDSFLQVLFDHANSGGFDGAFTNSNTMDVLRMALLEVARSSLGAEVSEVLIVDIVRQDS
jgi:hypothetical protein